MIERYIKKTFVALEKQLVSRIFLGYNWVREEACTTKGKPAISEYFTLQQNMDRWLLALIISESAYILAFYNRPVRICNKNCWSLLRLVQHLRKKSLTITLDYIVPEEGCQRLLLLRSSFLLLQLIFPYECLHNNSKGWLRADERRIRY